MQYTVLYPSGKVFELEGESFGVYPAGGPDLLVPSVLKGDEASVLDGRAIIFNEQGEVIYQPKDNPAIGDILGPWLTEHPEWPKADWIEAVQRNIIKVRTLGIVCLLKDRGKRGKR